MERYNLKNRKKWREKNHAVSVKNEKSNKKYYCLECFHTHLERFIWAMLEIILLAMSSLDTNI